MKDLLIILNPRIIPLVIDSLKNLPIDKIWISGYNEEDACNHINRIVKEKKEYDRFIIHSDDCIANPDILNQIRQIYSAGLIMSGYCKLAQNSEYINISKTQINLYEESFSWDSYNFYTKDELNNDDLYVGHYAGFSLTLIDRHLLEMNPLRTINGHQSDACFFYDLGNMSDCLTHKDWYLEHLKEDINKVYEAPFATTGIKYERCG